MLQIIILILLIIVLTLSLLLIANLLITRNKAFDFYAIHILFYASILLSPLEFLAGNIIAGFLYIITAYMWWMAWKSVRKDAGVS